MRKLEDRSIIYVLNSLNIEGYVLNSLNIEVYVISSYRTGT